MPTYDFLCPNHGVIEIEHSMSTPHPTHCPVCGAAIRRVYTSVPSLYDEKTGGWTGALGNTGRFKYGMTSPESHVPYR